MAALSKYSHYRSMTTTAILAEFIIAP